MSRIRSIKPKFWTDSKMVSLPVEVRLFYIGLWNFADDYGVLEDDPVSLKLEVMPADDFDAAGAVEMLVERGRLARMVTPDGSQVLVIRHFCDHQKIDKRASCRWGDPSTFQPVPTIPAESPPLPTDSAPGREGRGMEGKRTSAPTKSELVAVAAAPARRRDALWDTFAELAGYQPQTDRERGTWNSALKALRDANATPDELRNRYAEHKRRWPTASATLPSLAKHWGELGRASPKVSGSTQMLEQWSAAK